MFSENERATATPVDDLYNAIENLIAAVDHMQRGLEDPDNDTDEYREIMAGFQTIRREAMVRLDMTKHTHCALKHATGALMSLQDAFLSSNDANILQLYRDLAHYNGRLVKLGSQNGSEITPCASCLADKDVSEGFIKEDYDTVPTNQNNKEDY